MQGARAGRRRRDMATRQRGASPRRPAVATVGFLAGVLLLAVLWLRPPADPPTARVGADGPSATVASGAAGSPGSTAGTVPPGDYAPPGSLPGANASGVAASPTPDPDNAGCRADSTNDPVGRANELLDNRYTIGLHPAVELPADPEWDEDPLGSDNWEFTFHTLRFTLLLFDVADQTGDARYRDRAAELIRDWVDDNPRGASRSAFAWNDHSAAWRATVLVCAAGKLGDPAWLREAMASHGEALASEAFYVDVGNHALNQNVGLLDVACWLGERPWQDLAVARLDGLAGSSIDAEGVMNEQAVFYQLYNWRNYVRARDRVAACGLDTPPAFERVERMPDFLAHGTMPNGQYARLGDTLTRDATPIPGTIAEFAATQGQRGPAPEERFASYQAGFTFGRTGWGQARAFADEIAWTIRHGPGRAYHGHADHTAVTLEGYGTRLLEDSGQFTYNVNEWREYALSHRAHNVVIVDELEYNQSRRAELVRATTGPSGDEVVVADGGYDGVTNERRLVFSPALGYLVVEDTLSANRPLTFRQLWHLPADADPVASGSGVRSGRPGANVEILQLLPTERPQFVSGETDPIQGWLSEAQEHRVGAPVAQFVVSGSSARYITVLVPSADADAAVSVQAVDITPDGFSFRITLDGHTEVVTATASGATIAPG